MKRDVRGKQKSDILFSALRRFNLTRQYLMTVKKTPLHDIHLELGAKMVEFAGYMMPVQYKGIIDEHHTVRKSVGIFDVSHMGEFLFKGPGAAEYLQKMTVNDIRKLEPYRAQYSAICREDGGILDDLIIYAFSDGFMAIVNAANRQKDFVWFASRLPEDTEIEDISEKSVLLAVQGRNAEATLQKITDVDLGKIKYYRFAQGQLAGHDAIIARTGYTGEDGFEVAVHNRDACDVWQQIMTAGAAFGIEPIGLGARDTLRIEMKFSLYGNDIDESTNTIEAGLGWITKLDKCDFLGSQALQNVKANGPRRKLVGFELKKRAVPRQGYKIIDNGIEIGRVTSGTFSPTLAKGIGIGYVDIGNSEIGSTISIAVRDRLVAAEIVKTPFYQRPY
jgi:aminomethyltransferase